jgi:hypothetical protein
MEGGCWNSERCARVLFQGSQTRSIHQPMLLRPRTLPAAFIPPCLAYESGLWLHENKHDRFRVIARKDETRTGPPGTL